MPTFAILDTESLVQEKDKTRLGGDQSFSSDASPISAMSIRPGAFADEVDVLAQGYLDWQFEFKLDVVAGSNDMLDFVEGGGPLTATLPPGSYSMAALAAAIQTAMRAAGGLTYTVSLSVLNVLTIAAPGPFTIIGAAPLWAQIGFETAGGYNTYTGQKIERVAKVIMISVSGDVDASTTKVIEVVSEVADRLFSSDDKLRKHEADILKYLPAGRATFKDVHRRAQTLILAWLDTEGYLDYFADKITLAKIGDISDVTEWATFMALRLIFEGVQNAVNDVFEKKATTYQEREDFYRKRSVIKIDLNKDGVADKYTERVDVRSCRVMRR